MNLFLLVAPNGKVSLATTNQGELEAYRTTGYRAFAVDAYELWTEEVNNDLPA